MITYDKLIRWVNEAWHIMQHAQKQGDWRRWCEWYDIRKALMQKLKTLN